MEYPDRYAQPQDHLPPARSITQAGKRPAPMVEISSDQADETDRIAVFAIDGQVYTMPGELSATVTLVVLDQVARVGEVASIPFVLRTVLGDKPYDDLVTVPHLKGSQLEGIFKIVMDHVSSGVAETSGN